MQHDLQEALVEPRLDVDLEPPAEAALLLLARYLAPLGFNHEK
jgi:hypothetical protein